MPDSRRPAFVRRAVLVVVLALLVVLPALASAAVEVTNFGPLTYVRHAGPPDVYTGEFPAVAGAGVLHVRSQGLSSAELYLNGALVVAPHAFNRTVTGFDLPVALQAENVLRIKLNSAPRSSLTVSVTQVVEADGAAVVGPEGGTVEVSDAGNPAAGAVLRVPSGALGRAVVIRISVAPDAPDFPDGEPGLSPLRLEPSGLTFTVPATLEVPYDPAQLPTDASLGEDTLSLFSYDSGAEAWLSVPMQSVDTHAHRVSGAGVAHFSFFALRDDRLRPAPGGPLTPKRQLPVLLVHGFQLKLVQTVLKRNLQCGYGSSDAEEGRSKTFGYLPRLLQENLEVDVFELQYDTGRPIDESAPSVKRAIEKIMGAYSISPPAVTVIAHSMGGLVSRYAIDRAFSSDPLDSGPVPISALVTLATPHLGTVWANLADDPRFPIGHGTCESAVQMAVGSDFLEGHAGLNTVARTNPTLLAGQGPGYRLYVGADDLVVAPLASGLGYSWYGGPAAVLAQTGVATKVVIPGGCSDDGTGVCDHAGDDGIAKITSTDHAMWPELLAIVGTQMWHERDRVAHYIMPNSKIIERVRITDRTITIDTERMLAQGYPGAYRQGEFVVYTRPASVFEEVPYGRYDGYFERGDPFPTNLDLVFAWKGDGTAYVGTVGPDDVSLAAVVDGWARLPFTDRFVGTFLESQAFRVELRNLAAAGYASGITAADLQWSYYPFLGGFEQEIYHRFEKPIFRLGSAIYVQGIPASYIPQVMPYWNPFVSWATGAASRSFNLDVSGFEASYAVAVANCDNANWSSISLNGQEVVSSNHCCENYWRRTGFNIGSVNLATHTVWSQGAPHFNAAILADEVSYRDVTQSPPGGMSNNRSPLFSKLPPKVWTSE